MSKQGTRTLPEMLTELQRQASAKRDYVVPASVLTLAGDGQTFATVDGGDDGLSFTGTQLFHRQLGASMGIPAAYYEKMSVEDPTLLAHNVNTWLARSENSYMVRTMDYADGRGYVGRAFLSQRYRRIDNLAIASALLKLFLGMEGCEVESCNVGESNMFIKLIFRLKQYEVKPGDYVAFGIIIKNSEVGQGAAAVYPYILRLVCSNGMVATELGQRKHHVGRLLESGDDSYELYSDATLEAEDNAILLKMQDVARAAMDESKYPLIVGKLQDSTAAKITGAVPKVVELTAKNYGLRKQEQDDVLKYLIEGGDLSLYGLSNAVTRMSQDVENYDRAVELENVGWNMVTMAPEMWRAVNAR